MPLRLHAFRFVNPCVCACAAHGHCNRALNYPLCLCSCVCVLPNHFRIKSNVCVCTAHLQECPRMFTCRQQCSLCAPVGAVDPSGPCLPMLQLTTQGTFRPTPEHTPPHNIQVLKPSHASSVRADQSFSELLKCLYLQIISTGMSAFRQQCSLCTPKHTVHPGGTCIPTLQLTAQHLNLHPHGTSCMS